MITQTLSSPPVAPDPAIDDNTTFPAKTSAYLAWIALNRTEQMAVIAQFNTDIVNLNLLNGIVLRYTFDTTTADADPGNGKLRLGSATQNTSTVARVDQLDANGNTLTALLTTFDVSTSATKGRLRLQHATDPTKWLIFALTAKATPAGYFNFTLTPIASSAASPFANGDTIILSYDWMADLGATGPTGPAWTGGSIASRAYTTPNTQAFSATPTFDASLSNVFSMGLLTANVTSMTISNPVDGQTISIRVTQDATGNRTIATPTGAKITGVYELAASRSSWLTLTYVGTVNGVAVNRWEGGWTVVAP